MKTILISVVASTALVTASPLNSRDATEGTLACLGSQRPNWDDCDDLVKAKNWAGDNAKEALDSGSEDPCVEITAPSINCMMQACKGSGRKKIYGDEIYAAYKKIRDQCEPSDAAGGIIDMSHKDNSVQFMNNPDYEPKKRDLYDIASELVQRSALLSRKDKEFKVDSYSFGVTRSGKRVKYGSTAPGGSSVAISKSETNEWHTEASSEMSAGLEGIISASVSITMGESHSNTNTKTETYMISCDKDQEGQLYWYPHWDIYYGTLKPSGKKLEIYVPLDGEEGEFQVTCLG